jgi:hypothetical protein
VPIDSTGLLSGTAAGARACLVRYWSYFAYGVASWPQDACTQASLQAEAARGNFSLKSVLMAIIHSPHFTRRVAN